MPCGRRDKRNIAKKKRTSSCATGLRNLGASVMSRRTLSGIAGDAKIAGDRVDQWRNRGNHDCGGIFARTGRLQRRIMLGCSAPIAIAIATWIVVIVTSIAMVITMAIVVVMTVHACPIDRLDIFCRRSNRLCDCCQWRFLLRIDLVSGSASVPSRVGRRRLRVPWLDALKRCTTLALIG